MPLHTILHLRSLLFDSVAIFSVLMIRCVYEKVLCPLSRCIAWRGAD